MLSKVKHLTRLYLLCTRLTTWCQLETYIEDGYLLISGVYRQRHECGHESFPRNNFVVQLLTRNVNLYTSCKDDIRT